MRKVMYSTPNGMVSTYAEAIKSKTFSTVLEKIDNGTPYISEKKRKWLAEHQK